MVMSHSFLYVYQRVSSGHLLRRPYLSIIPAAKDIDNAWPMGCDRLQTASSLSAYGYGRNMKDILAEYWQNIGKILWQDIGN